MRGRHTGISSQKPCVPSPETSTTPRCSQTCSSVWGRWPSHTLAVSIAALRYNVYLLVRYSCPKLFFSLSEFDIRHFSCLVEWREGEAKARQHTDALCTRTAQCPPPRRKKKVSKFPRGLAAGKGPIGNPLLNRTGNARDACSEEIR